MRTRVAVGVLALAMIGALVAGLLVAGGDDDGSSVTTGRPRTLDLAGDTEDAGDAAAAEPAFAPAQLVEYVVDGDLSGVADRARAFRVTPRVDDATVMSVAKALGLEGQVGTDEAANRTVVDGDRQLSVGPDGYWWYGSTSGAVSSDVAVAEPGCAGPDCPVSSDDPPPPPPQRPPGLPDGAEAERIARELAHATGAEVDEAATTVIDNVQSWTVEVRPAVTTSTSPESTGGDSAAPAIPTSGWSWHVEVGVGGKALSASGHLTRIERADEYPLIGVDAALQRLRDGNPFPIGPQPLAGAETLGAPGVATDDPAVATDQPKPEPAEEPTAVEPDPGQTEPGSSGGGVSGDPGTGVTIEPVPPPEPIEDPAPVPEPEPQRVAITGVRLGLAYSPASSGGAWLVPVYLFTTRAEDGTTGEVTVLALSDEFVKTVEPGTGTGSGVGRDLPADDGREPAVEPQTDPAVKPEG